MSLTLQHLSTNLQKQKHCFVGTKLQNVLRNTCFQDVMGVKIQIVVWPLNRCLYLLRFFYGNPSKLTLSTDLQIFSCVAISKHVFS